MRIAVFCNTDELCFSCYETGGEYGVPLVFHCKAEKSDNCKFPDKQCMYRKQLLERLEKKL